MINCFYKLIREVLKRLKIIKATNVKDKFDNHI